MTSSEPAHGRSVQRREVAFIDGIDVTTRFDQNLDRLLGARRPISALQSRRKCRATQASSRHQWRGAIVSRDALIRTPIEQSLHDCGIALGAARTGVLHDL